MAANGQWSGQWGGNWLGDVDGGGGNPLVPAALKVAGAGIAQLSARRLVAAALVAGGSSDYLLSAITDGGAPPVDPQPTQAGGYSGNWHWQPGPTPEQIRRKRRRREEILFL